MNVIGKIRRKLTKIGRKCKRMRLQPIHVFLFHQVSDAFDADTMYACDWTETARFQHNMEVLRKEYKFIPLDEAYRKMKRDVIRLRRYAVLTSDDGWASLKNILPWLHEQGIPVTLFLNPGYFDGRHFRERNTEKYLLEEDVRAVSEQFPLVSFGLHGWEHTNAATKTEDEFRDEVRKSSEALRQYPCYVPFFAYTWGKHNDMTRKVLKEFDLVPVLIDKETNMDDVTCIHRELLDGMAL